jgi:hypothetical protein
MSLTTIQISEESAALLAEQAAAHGLSVEAWVEELAKEKIMTGELRDNQEDVLSAIASILGIQKRVKPDPEGWTIRQYIDYGRR